MKVVCPMEPEHHPTKLRKLFRFVTSLLRVILFLSLGSVSLVIAAIVNPAVARALFGG